MRSAKAAAAEPWLHVLFGLYLCVCQGFTLLLMSVLPCIFCHETIATSDFRTFSSPQEESTCFLSLDLPPLTSFCDSLSTCGFVSNLFPEFILKSTLIFYLLGKFEIIVLSPSKWEAGPL